MSGLPRYTASSRIYNTFMEELNKLLDKDNNQSAEE